MSTSPEPGNGSGTSVHCNTSGPPGAAIVTAYTSLTSARPGPRFSASRSTMVAVAGPGTNDGGMRGAFLAVLGVDLVLVAAEVLRYPPFLDQPGSAIYLAEPVVLLVGYSVVVLAVTRSPDAGRRRVLRTGAFVGLVLG